MLIKTLLLSVMAASAPGAGPNDRATPPGPSVQLWTNRDDDLLRSGESVRVYFRAQDNAYVTVFRVDTDGRLEVLFPESPWDNNYARAGDRYEIRRYGRREAFVVNEYPGQGFLFAVTSRDPFDYAELVTGSIWDYRFVAREGRIIGDPYVAFTDLIDVIVPLNYVEYDYDVLPYHVQEHYDYPRFLCYDCHSYAQYPVWDPYQDTCVRFSIVVYDDPYYYPARVREGTRVVFTRPTPAAAGPRYAVVERNPVEPFVRRVNRATPINDPGPRRTASGENGEPTGTIQRPHPVPIRRQLIDLIRRPPTVRADSTARPQPTLQRREPSRPDGKTVPRRPPARTSKGDSSGSRR